MEHQVCTICNDFNKFLHNYNNTNKPTVTIMLYTPQGKRRKIVALLDTGATKDYVSLEVASWLITNGVKSNNNENLVIGSGFKDVCTKCTSSISFDITALDSELSTINSIDITMTALVIDASIDVIIGISSIKQNDLILHYPSKFLSQDGQKLVKNIQESEVRRNTDTILLQGGETESGGPMCSLLDNDVLSNPANITERARAKLPLRMHYDLQVDNKLIPTRYGLDSKEPVEPVTDMINYISEKESRNKIDSTTQQPTNYSTHTEWDREDISEIRMDQLESIESEYVLPDKGGDSNFEMPTKIFGPKTLRRKINRVLIRHKKRFRTTVGKVPAKLEPFCLKLDSKEQEEKWFTNANKLPPRRLDKTRQFEMNKLIMLLITLGCLQSSTATHYSHPFVVPKPGDNNWRMVLDYKNLNKLTSSEGWPIPNIRDMIYRIGATRPKYFVVMDLTSGYHQAPISEDSRKLTAFITQFGVFEWLRLPMGLKGAPSYFQRQMQDKVLNNLCMNICEIYLDDCIIFADSEDQLIDRLTTVLQRFEEFDITVNPKKCVFGLNEIECVGHTINEHGHSFTQERLDGILEIPRPTNQKALKMFMGVVGYIRDSLRDFAKITAPLNLMLHAYSKAKAKRHKLEWTEEAAAAFTTLRQSIHDCPLLWFIDDTSPIILYTDASDYGIGAYLCQVVDGLERPIGFLSKSLINEQGRWNTAEKEGFAIFFALSKWEYLLRDRKFIVRTDHDNLTKLKQEMGHLKKVQRWFTVFQAYDCTFTHWAGEDNIVADGLSRLCPLDAVAEQLLVFGGPCNPEDAPSDEEDDAKIPRQYWKTIRSCHNSVVGHHGNERTIQKLMASGHTWRYLRTHVNKFIKQCPCCQKMSVLKTPIHTKPFTLSKYDLGECVYIDYIEKLLPDENGNNHIIVIIDAFSRWIELYPCKDNLAENTALALLKFYTHFSRSDSVVVVSDNGQTLVANIVEELTELIGIKHDTTMAYSSQENGMVERANKEVVRHLRNIIFDNKVLLKWSNYLPLVQRIMNVSTHSATGVSPAAIVYGNTIDLSVNFLIDRTPNRTKTLSKWTADMLSAQHTIVAYARKNLQARDNRHIEDKSSLSVTSYSINSYVLVEHRHNSLRKGPRSKLLPYLKGPMKIIGSEGDKYTVECLVTNTPIQYHVSKLRPFYCNPGDNPLTFALRDDAEGNTYQLLRITNMRGDPKGSKKELFFEVFWTGYDIPTWEPWSGVRKTTALHSYLEHHTNPRVRALKPKDKPTPEPTTVDPDTDDSDQT